MKYLILIVYIFTLVICIEFGCTSSSSSSDDSKRHDNAYKLNINLTGSLQNPAFSPDGNSILFTRFSDGYNSGASDLYIYNLVSEETTLLISDGESNVNLPGSSWNENINSIVFSSARDPHDEIFLISDTGSTGDETQITDRTDKQSYEPTLSPDGSWIVFESHAIDVEDDGVITKCNVNGVHVYTDLTGTDNNKQPNWSPAGGKILYQKEDKVNGIWAIWTMDEDGTHKATITGNDESATDAVFSNNGQWIIYSSENENVSLSNIYKIPSTGGVSTQITFYDGYDGAPSISPDSTKIAFESVNGDPDGSIGTRIWIIDISL